MENNNKVYYRASDREYQIGEIIKLGTGVYSKLWTGSNHFSYEIFLELAREKYFPEKPSRTNIIFSCPTPEALFNYVTTYHPDKIFNFWFYKIKPTNPDYKYHIGDFNFEKLRFRNKGEISFEEGIQDMLPYWEAKNIEPSTTEVLLGSDCEVIGKSKITIDVQNIVENELNDILHKL